MTKSDFPYIQVIDGQIHFKDGDIVKLPKVYDSNNEVVKRFFQKVINAEGVPLLMGTDPLGFHFILSNNLCNVGVIIGNGSGKVRDNGKKYPDNRFSKEFFLRRIEKERKLMSFEDFIPREFVTQNIHELRNLNAKVSSNIDELLDVQGEEEWEDKFDRANENVKKIFVASRLIKFILDNIKFYIPDYINSIELDPNRSFRVHRSVSKIVKIYKNDFKKNKVEVELLGGTNKVLPGDRELFELILMLLVENAIKYSIDPTTLAPKVEVFDKKGIANITIKSYGKIVPQEDRAKLFTKGFRSTVHRGINEGTGMGLHNSQGLVKLFKGELKYSAEKINLVDNYEIGWNCFEISI